MIQLRRDISILTAALAVFGCSQSTGPQAGGGGTDWEARTVAVAGFARLDNGTPAAGALVRLLPDTHRVPLPGPSASPDGALGILTGADGWFRIDSLDSGVYSLEILHGNVADRGVHRVISLTHPDDSVVVLDSLTLIFTGAIAGTVDRSTIGPRSSLYARVIGLDRIASVDTAGVFRISGLAPSPYMVEIVSPDAAIRPFAVPVTVQSDRISTLPPIRLSVDSAVDLGVVKALLDTLGLDTVPIAAVCSTAGGRVIGLNLTNYDIPVLPETVGGLTMLRSLWVAGDSITSLPSSIGMLAELEFLSISNSAIAALPPEIGRCTRLRTVLAMHTRLTTLPDSIGGCASLERLEINDNAIASLPETVAQLINITALNVANNRLCVVSGSVGAWLDLKMPDWSFSQVCP